ncbi:MAG TPA: hypothetical protein VN888_17810 [Mycobacterium sp.]|nr:hypothetical protein [Mycobacterium sp.]
MKSIRPPTGTVDRVRRSWATTIRRHETVRGLALRFVLAAAVLMPAAAATIALGEPFAISAIASTVAIVLHAPRRYHQRPHRILACYAAGIVVSATISLAGAFVGAPPLMVAGASAVIIVASPAGRLHPPTACIPLQITAHIAPLALVGRWLTFTGLSASCLAALWVLTTRLLARYDRTELHLAETPCAKGPQP